MAYPDTKEICKVDGSKHGWEVKGKSLKGGSGGWSWPVFTKAPCYLNRWAWILPARSRAYCLSHDEWGLMSQLCRQLSARRLYPVNWEISSTTDESYASSSQSPEASCQSCHPSHISFPWFRKTKAKESELHWVIFPPICIPTTICPDNTTSLSLRYALPSWCSVWNEKL